MIEEAPNVVTEDGLRSLLADGYLLEVVCKEGAEKRHNSWYGAWVIRAVAPDGRDDKMLVTSRSVLKLRDFKTISSGSMNTRRLFLFSMCFLLFGRNMLRPYEIMLWD